jgi:RecJ-like exonuclease
MKSADNSCPRCNGSGKVPFRNAGGICFQCQGSGFISVLTIEEKTEIADSIAIRKAAGASFYAQHAPVNTDENPADENWFFNLFP